MSFWRSVYEVAETESMSSHLPGFYNGPADAYRHLIGAAEMQRRFGWALSRIVVNGNEYWRTHAPHEGQSPGSRQMDDHNNALGFGIGLRARSYEDVVRMAREAVMNGLAEGGSGRDGTPMWLPAGRQSEGQQRRDKFPVRPTDWSTTISLHGYRYADERFDARRAFRDGTGSEREAAVRERLLATPVAEWSQEDMRAAMRLPAYRNSDDPEHRAWQARVRAWFEAQEEACDGVAEVDAYTRQGPNGPIQVSAHRRAVPCGD